MMETPCPDKADGLYADMLTWRLLSLLLDTTLTFMLNTDTFPFDEDSVHSAIVDFRMISHSNIMLQTVLSLMASTGIDDTFVDFHNSSTRCFTHYGCFSTDYPWTSAQRPVSLLPLPPSDIRPGYCVYTRTTAGAACQPVSMTETPSVLNPSRPMVFISHGFIESGDKPWIKELARQLLIHSDLNVIAIDWSGGSAPPYGQAVANTRVVGTMTAHLIHHLASLGMRTEDLHVIGHSLGAHIAGYIGQVLRDRFNIRLARISALDPAEPHFTKTHPLVRLDPTDADFVDVTHTDAGPFLSGGLGLLEPVGHVDFYPNGGVNMPGCSEGVSMEAEAGGLVGGLQRMLSCNHVRSYQYYTESVNTRCPFLAVTCDTWDHYSNGSCFTCAAHVCARYGYGALHHLLTHWRGASLSLYKHRLFLMTATHAPFCQEHYLITLHVSAGEQSERHGGEIGMFWLTLMGRNGSTHRMQLSHSEQYYGPGSQHRTVVAGRGVGPLQSVYVEWEYRVSVLNPLSWRVLALPKIYVDTIVVRHLEADTGYTLCIPDGRPIMSTEPVLLHPRDTCGGGSPAA